MRLSSLIWDDTIRMSDDERAIEKTEKDVKKVREKTWKGMTYVLTQTRLAGF